MAGVYSSLFTGKQVDAALGVVINSKVSASEMSVLHSFTAGTAVANKVLVCDENRSVSGLAVLGADVLKSRVLLVDNLLEAVSTNPQTGCVFIYALNGKFYSKTSDGVVSPLGGGSEIRFPFSGVSTITCDHNTGNQYPIVDVYSGAEKILCPVTYQNVNTLVVSLGEARDGVVIIRSV